ncbi:MAG: phosphatidate cytidylyltransferase [Chthoniobacterales bacterium]
MSTITLWIMIVATVFFQSEIGYWILIATAALGSLWEYFWLLRVGCVPRHWHIGYVAGIALLLGNFWFLHSPRFAASIATGGGAIFAFDAAILAITVIVLFLREFITAEPKRTAAEGIAFTLFGIIYIPWFFSFVAKLLYLTPLDSKGLLTGPYYVIFLLVVTKFTDVGAFVCGSLFGRHHFFPNISPKKTWEGCAGALVVSVLSGWGIFLLLKQHLLLLHLHSALLISLILGVAAIAGDLAESLLKRSLHTKDSSDALPGIGGGLDLIDSVLFTAPLFYFIMQLL